MRLIFQLFQIKKDELKPSIILFFHSFFLVSVVIVSKTTRDSFFLSRFDKSFLPLMYILTALIMWKGVGYIQKVLNDKNLLQQNIILHTSFAFGTILFIFFNNGISSRRSWISDKVGVFILGFIKYSQSGFTSFPMTRLSIITACSGVVPLPINGS